MICQNVYFALVVFVDKVYVSNASLVGFYVYIKLIYRRVSNVSVRVLVGVFERLLVSVLRHYRDP